MFKAGLVKLIHNAAWWSSWHRFLCIYNRKKKKQISTWTEHFI